MHQWTVCSGLKSGQAGESFTALTINWYAACDGASNPADYSGKTAYSLPVSLLAARSSRSSGCVLRRVAWQFTHHPEVPSYTYSRSFVIPGIGMEYLPSLSALIGAGPSMTSLSTSRGRTRACC